MHLLVPVISYTYTRKNYLRCHPFLKVCLLITTAFMLFGGLAFELTPSSVLGIFGSSPDVLDIGVPAFRIIGIRLIPAVFSLAYPNFFQAIGAGKTCIFLSLLRQIFTLLPSFYLFSRIGVGYTWLAFPVAESISGFCGWCLYRQRQKEWKI